MEVEFGGIWIDDTEEYAKFVAAVERYGGEQSGEGFAYTDNFFYAYYHNADGDAIPFLSVNLNHEDSQELISILVNEYGIERSEGTLENLGEINENFRIFKTKSSSEYGDNLRISDRIRNIGLGNNIFQKGRYFDRPNVYVKTKRADWRGQVDDKISFSIIPASTLAQEWYDEAVRVQGGWRGFRNKVAESWFDEMRSILKLQEAIEMQTGTPIRGIDNAYAQIIALSSKNHYDLLFR